MVRTIILLFIICLFGQLNGQSSHSIEVVRSQENKVFDRIIFYDTLSRLPLKEILFSEINPYDKDYSKEIGHFSSFRSEVLSKKYGNNFLGVSFQFNPFDNEGRLIEDSRESTIIIFNSIGEEVVRFEELPFDASEPLLDNEGRYLGYHFGGLIYDDLPKDIGFNIYDLNLHKMIYEIRTADIAGSYIQNEVFVFAVPENNSRIYFVFNPETGLLFKKRYSQTEQALTARFDIEGVIFNEYGKEKLVTYLDAFQLIEATE